MKKIEKKDIRLTYQEYKPYCESRIIMEDLKKVFQAFIISVPETNQIIEKFEDVSDKISNVVDDTIKRFKEKGKNKESKFIFFSDVTSKTPTNDERAYFFAVFRFLKHCKDANDFLSSKTQENFKDWIIVVRNLIENAEIATDDELINCLKCLNEISENDVAHGNVYDILRNKKYNEPKSKLDRQLVEEIEKAIKINENPKLKETIHKAEDWGFFNGTIRFLYKNVDKEDWDDFGTKWGNAQELFDENETDVSVAVTVKLLKLYGCFKEIEDRELLFVKTGYTSEHGKKNFRDDILCGENDIACKAHELLMNNANGFLSTQENLDNLRYNYSAFVENEELLMHLRDIPANDKIVFTNLW